MKPSLGISDHCVEFFAGVFTSGSFAQALSNCRALVFSFPSWLISWDWCWRLRLQPHVGSSSCGSGTCSHCTPPLSLPPSVCAQHGGQAGLATPPALCPASQPSCLHIQWSHPSPPSEEVKKPPRGERERRLRVREDGVENLTLPLTAFPPVSEPAHGCKTTLHTTWSH